MQVARDASTRSNQKIHPIMDYLRSFAKKCLPKIDQTAVPFKCKPDAKPDGKGMHSDKDKIHLNNPRLLRDVLPNNPHCVARPAVRAAAFRPSNGVWDDKAKKKARDQFHVPEGLRLVFVIPELFDRDLLKHSDSHKKGSDCMTPCPICGSNKLVKFKQFTCDINSIKRCLNKELTQDVIIGVQHVCTSSHFTMGKRKGDGPKTWISYTPANLKSQPESLRRRHLEFFGEIDESESVTHLLMSPGFSDRLLFLSGNFDGFLDSMDWAHNLRVREAKLAHMSFCKEQNLSHPVECPATMQPSHFEARCQELWPAFDGDEITDFFPCISATALVKMWKMLHRKVEPCLLRDLFSRLPGTILRID